MCAQDQSPCSEESPQSSDEDEEVHESSQVLEASYRLLDVQSRIPEHMNHMYLQSCVHLTEEQSIEFGEVLIKFGDIFAKHDNDLGLSTKGEHTIDMGHAKPIKQQMRRTPLCFANEEESYLKKMLDNGIIQPSNSEWASPSVPIQKKDGSVHWKIDFRAVNKVTKKDSYPLPLIEECLDALEGEFMSTLDMNSRYYQFAMALADRCKTAFLTKYGLFEFTRMAMGLCNAPATFQRAMQLVFHGMLWKQALTYLDDLNVLGRHFKDHLSNLVQSFERLRKYNLTQAPEVSFLPKGSSFPR